MDKESMHSPQFMRKVYACDGTLAVHGDTRTHPTSDLGPSTDFQ